MNDLVNLSGVPEYRKSWLAHQKIDKNWRPKDYYQQVAGRWRTVDAWPIEHNEDFLRTCLMEIFIQYYHQCEDQVFYFEVGDKIPLGDELEILSITNGRVAAAHNDFDLWNFIVEFHLTNIITCDSYNLSSHFAFANSIIENVSEHWIHEMYLLYVLSGGDKTRCGIVPWDFAK